ncbi:MAG: sigma-54 dependent transcriptional regulator [bacterium]
MNNIITAYGSLDSAIQALRLGASDYLTKPFDLEAVSFSVRKAIESSRLQKEVSYFRTRVSERFGLHRLIGESGPIKELRQQIIKIAQSEAATVLLQGESGTGKDLVAHIIHQESKRAHFPFVDLNCSALPSSLIESELFGYERGAFTDAKERKIGLLEVANKGTIYLDEIGDMTPALQAKILSVIENKRFRRLGGLKDLALDLRFIAASNKNLSQEVEKGNFRQDLYYRLKVFPIFIPPLRQRMSDLPLLVDFFLDELRKEFRKKIVGVSDKTLNFLLNYPWPGNIRELKNVLERAFIICDEGWIEPEHLPPELINTFPDSGQTISSWKLPPQGISLRELESDLIRQALERSGGNQVKAAKLLGLGRDALRYRLKKIKST